MDALHIGKIVVAGKADPLVFAADMAANSLLWHLGEFPADTPLNNSAALTGWVLKPITYTTGPGMSCVDIF